MSYWPGHFCSFQNLGIAHTIQIPVVYVLVLVKLLRFELTAMRMQAPIRLCSTMSSCR